MKNLTVVIPAYNEEESILQGKLKRVVEWLNEKTFETQLIVVDDGSDDRTAELALQQANRVITIGHKGKAAAIMTGFLEAEGEMVLFTDMDQATPIAEAGKLHRAIRKSADVAIGTRGLVREHAPIGRYILSWGHFLLHRLLLGLRINDTQCGFKAFKREVILNIMDHLKIYDYSKMHLISFPSVSSGFDTEVLLVAQKLGYSIEEVPVQWNYQETRRVDLTRDAIRGVADLYGILSVNIRGGYSRKKSKT